MLKTTFRSNDYKAIDRLNSPYCTRMQLRTFLVLLAIAFLGISFLSVKTFQAAKAYEKTQVGKPVVMEER